MDAVMVHRAAARMRYDGCAQEAPMKVNPRLYRATKRLMNRLPDRVQRVVAREAWLAYRKGHHLTHRLDYLFWETTLRCNLRCAHCGSSCTTDPLPDELTTAEIDDTLAHVASRQDPRSIMLVASGGEPLMREDLLEVMGREARRGFPWGMVTNGLLVDDAMVEQLELTGMRTVTVSVDGTEEHHDRIRQRDGSYRKALEALQRLNRSPYFSIVELITTLNRHNAGDLPFLLELVREMGIRYWRIGTVAPIGRAKLDPDLLVTGEQLRDAAEFIARTRGRYRALDLSFACENYLGERYEPRVRKHRFACWAGVRTGGILANGDISACPDLPRERFVQGNVRQRPFMDVWEDAFGEFRDRRWMKVGPCEACDQWRVCGGGGLHFHDPEINEIGRCHHNLLAEATGQIQTP